MQSTEEQALATYRLTLPTLLLLHMTVTNNLLMRLKREEHFLDCLVKHNDELRRKLHRKLTRTDRLVDESCYNPTSHKGTTIKTMSRCAQFTCDSLDTLCNEDEYLQHVFHKNDYNSDFKLNTHNPTTTTATIPDVRGASEIISCWT